MVLANLIQIVQIPVSVQISHIFKEHSVRDLRLYGDARVASSIVSCKLYLFGYQTLQIYSTCKLGGGKNSEYQQDSCVILTLSIIFLRWVFHREQ